MKKSATVLTGVSLVVLLFGSLAEGQVSPQRFGDHSIETASGENLL